MKSTSTAVLAPREPGTRPGARLAGTRTWRPDCGKPQAIPEFDGPIVGSHRRFRTWRTDLGKPWGISGINGRVDPGSSRSQRTDSSPSSRGHYCRVLELIFALMPCLAQVSAAVLIDRR